VRPFLQPCRLTICPGRWIKREKEKRREEREREKAPRPQIGSICLVHKQSRNPQSSPARCGAKLAPTSELEGLLGAHIHMQTETTCNNLIY